MPTPYFEKGDDTLILTGGIQYPGEDPLEKTQVIDRTAGGEVHVESLGVDIQRYRLVFKGATGSLYAEIITWFDTIADGAANTFTYYDETGSSQTVRLLTNPLVFRRIANDVYQGELLLEVAA